MFRSSSRWRRFVSSLQSGGDFIKSALGIGPTKRRCEVRLGRYRRQFRLEALEPRVLLSYGTTDDPLDSQAQLLAFLRRKVEDESLPSSLSDAQPLAPLAAGEAFVPIAEALPGGEGGAGLLPAVEDRPAQPAEPPLFVRVSDATAIEGQALVFTVSLSAPAAETVQVAYLLADGTATVESGDYQKLRGQVSFAPGQTVQTITVPTADDDCQEGDEHFWLVLHKPRGARIADGGGTGVIIDNDSLPKINISNVQVHPGETAMFFVILSNPYREPVSVQYATVADTPAAMDQFEPVWGTLSFEPGEVAARVAVPTLPAAKNTAGGSFSVVLSDPQNAHLDKSAGTASFTDKPEGSQFPAARPTGLEPSQGQESWGDGGQMGMLSVQTPTVSVYLSESSSPVTEGQSAIVVFELSHSVDYDVAIQFRTAPGTADASDYYHSEGTVVIPAGSSIEWLWLYTVYDYLDEDDEHFWLVLNDGGYFSAPSSLCITIIDDDAEPVVSIYDDAVNEGENSGYSPAASFLVALSAPSGKDVLVDWRTWPGTADEHDYSGGSGQLRFLPQWDPWLWVEIPVNNDPVYEPEPEQFFVELWAFQNCSPGDPWAVCIIYDDDLPPEVNISEDQQCSEPQGGSLTLTLTVSLSQPCQEEVTVSWQTQEAWWSSRAPATADEDYRSASGTVVFAPYETTPKTIEVTILDDCYAEEDEDFAVYLTGTTGGGASTGRYAALVTIRDYDLVDIDVDSNNDGWIDPENGPSGTDDPIENEPGYLGEVLLVNDNDYDEDGIPNYADGYQLPYQVLLDLAALGISPENAIAEPLAQAFSPLVLHIPDHIDLAIARLQFVYSASDPWQVSVIDGVLVPAPGRYRLWLKDGCEQRVAAPVNACDPAERGDFVPGTVYPLSDDPAYVIYPEQLGLSSDNRTVTLYLEAVAASSQTADKIGVYLAVDGAFNSPQTQTDEVNVTAVATQLRARKVQDNAAAEVFNQAADWLDEKIEDSKGAYLPWNNDDDDYDGTPDSVQNMLSEFENDLLPITVHRPRDTGGSYSLKAYKIVNQKRSETQVLRVWRRAEQAYELVTGPLDFGAQQQLDLFVDFRIQPPWGSGSYYLELTWTNNGKEESGDRIKIRPFEVHGPRNVPGYACYEYVAFGGAPGAESLWVAPRNGTELSSTGGADPDKQQVHWGQGALFGKARYKASEEYTWAFDVNVVRVDIDFPSPEDPNPTSFLAYADQQTNGPVQSKVADRAGLIESTTGRSQPQHANIPYSEPLPEPDRHLDTPAMRAKINVTRIEGPVRGGRMYGVDRIELGIAQTLKFTQFEFIYEGNNSWKPEDQRGRTLEGNTLLDVITKKLKPTATYNNIQWTDVFYTRPWYDSTGVTAFSTQHPRSVYRPEASQLVQNVELSVRDSPMMGAPRPFQIFAGQMRVLTRLNIQCDFTIMLVARTIDERNTNDAHNVYTQRAVAQWSFKASGDINGGTLQQFGTWTPDPGVGVSGDTRFTEKSDGSQLPASIVNGLIVNKQLDELKSQ